MLILSRCPDCTLFRSSFSKGQLRLPTQSELTNSKMTFEGPSSIVTITEGFDLWHALILCLYMDKICFATNPEGFQGEFGDYTLIAIGEGIYALAHRLLFDSITSKALTFLKATCNIHMNTARVLDHLEFCMGMWGNYTTIISWAIGSRLQNLRIILRNWKRTQASTYICTC